MRLLLLLPLHTRLAAAGTIWGVTTTIFDPTPAVQTFITALAHAKLVVVGDLKTNHSAWNVYALASPAVKYLSPDEQRSLPFSSVALLPWNHFGRKNVGFLYAISQKADWIFDFDDDNVLRTPLEGGLLHALMAPELRSKHALIQPQTHLYNPYPDFRPQTSDGKAAFVWPRGFPLDFIHDSRTHTQPASKREVAATDVHIYQSLANNNPDVDAIYRMTREIPLTFTAENRVLVLPNGTFAPMNAQATLFRASAAWGLVLPITDACHRYMAQLHHGALALGDGRPRGLHQFNGDAIPQSTLLSEGFRRRGGRVREDEPAAGSPRSMDELAGGLVVGCISRAAASACVGQRVAT